MRIVAILGVLILLVGGGLAVRFFLMDGSGMPGGSEVMTQIGNLGSNTTTDAQDGSGGDSMSGASSDTGSTGSMGNMANQAVDQMQDAASDAMSNAQSAMDQVADTADQMADNAVDAMNQMAESATGRQDPLAQQDLRQTLDPGAQQAGRTADTMAPEPEGGPTRLTLPLDCEIGADCYIQSYVNVGTPEEPRDYACGSLSYGEHRGTDFRAFDYTLMESGIDVIAAAPGVVANVRDGMPDANFRLFGTSAVFDRGRGNVVVLEHDDGTQTAYSHLRRGSIVVQPGDRVSRGQTLAQMGMSGLTEFPHLHFEVRRDGRFIDPFSGAARHSSCGQDGETLWRDSTADMLVYPRTLIMHTGFADEILNRAAVEYGLFNTDGIGTDSDALVLHVYLAGIQPGDGFVAEITAPDGSRFVKSGRRFDDFQMAELLAIGRNDLIEPLQTGTYIATFSYFRQDDTGQDTEILNFTDRVTIR